MGTSTAPPIVEELRERIQRLEGAVTRRWTVLSFGVKEIDRRLPEGGLALGALHEVAGGGNGVVDGAAAALFAAGVPALAPTRPSRCSMGDQGAARRAAAAFRLSFGPRGRNSAGNP